MNLEIKVNFATCNSPLPEGCPQDGVFEQFPSNWIFTPQYARELTSEEVPPYSSIDVFCDQPPLTHILGFYAINGNFVKQNPITKLPYQPRLKQRARDLRSARNLPEVLFWIQVTKNRFHKIDFDRQRAIGKYIVDFYVKKLGLVVEIDGDSHKGKEAYDKLREEYLISLGLRIYRIDVASIMKRIDLVMAGLEEYIIKQYGESYYNN